ncbi:CHAT domain-containing protein [Hypoxylon crocopeplum]|nr:CHAT domain-containing protein [Hypoxylon crocopeplum]
MADITHENGIDRAISHSRDLTLLGDFDRALAALDIAAAANDVPDGDKVRVYRAAARVFMRRGFPTLAKEWLEKAAAIAPRSLSRTECLALDVHKAYISIVGCGGQDDGDASILEAQEYLDSRQTSQPNDEDIVLEMHAFLGSIALMRQLLRGGNTNLTVATRIGSLIRQLEGEKRYRDMGIIMQTFLNATERDKSIDWLENILRYDDVPIVLRGLWCLELAKLLAAKSQMERFESWLNEAEDAFKACNHTWGPLEVRLLRLQHGLEGSTTVLADLVDLASQHLQSNYPIGVLQALLQALKVAFQNGDIATYLGLQEVLHNVCTIAGLQHARISQECQLLSALNAGASDAGKVLQVGQRLYQECLEYRYWQQAYLVGRVVSLSHAQLGNIDEAEPLAQEIYDLCRRESLQLEPQAAYHLAFVQSERVRANKALSLSKFQGIIDWLEATVTDRFEAGELEEREVAADKLCLIACLQDEMLRAGIHDSAKMSILVGETIARARLLAEKLPQDVMDRINSNCDDLLITQLLHAGKRQLTDEMELEAIQICGKLITLYGASGPKFSEAMKYMIRALCHQQRFQKELNLEKRVPHLVSAEKDLLEATEIFESIRSRQHLMIARHGLSRLYVTARDLYQGLISGEAIFNCLKSLESTSDMLRRELSVLGSLTALRQKQRFAARKEVRDLYQWAIGISIVDQNHEAMWLWSQKRKARSISDLLGIGVMVPASIKKAISEDDAAYELYQKLTSLAMALDAAPEGERIYIRQHLEEVEDEIRNHQTFKEFVSLRDGTVRGITDLNAVAAQWDNVSCARDVVFVDWVLHGDFIFIVTANTSKPVETCRSMRLPIKGSYVRKWIQDHFATNEDRRRCLQRDNFRDPSKPMRQLDGLIAPLVDVSKPGDLLIFSTTGCLSSLPLHALQVYNAPLISRNPIVYSPNFPVLEMCLARSKNPAQAQTGGAAFFGILDVEGEARAIYEQMNSLAKSHENGQSFCGSRATKGNFAAAAQGARLIHYHGHCQLAVDNPLKQCLVLAVVEEDVQTLHPSGRDKSSPAGGAEDALNSHEPQKPLPQEQSTVIIEGSCDTHQQPSIFQPSQPLPTVPTSIDRYEPASGVLLSRGIGSDEPNCLAVPEVFDLQLAAPLVVLVGCESASQTVSEGDEPLGLVSGFLCAGAASVIGASWPIPSSAGRSFSDAFYAELDSQMSVAAAGELVNVAVAMQESVLSIMDDPNTSATFYWASFCLYGSWLFQR